MPLSPACRLVTATVLHAAVHLLALCRDHGLHCTVSRARHRRDGGEMTRSASVSASSSGFDLQHAISY